MGKERSEGKLGGRYRKEKSSSVMGWKHWPKTRWLPARCLPHLSMPISLINEINPTFTSLLSVG